MAGPFLSPEGNDADFTPVARKIVAMTARSVLGRMSGRSFARTLVAVALVAGVLLGTGAAASATPGIDPFQPIASGPTLSSGGGSSSPTTTPTTTATSGGGSGTTTGSATGSSGGTGTTSPAPAQSGTAGGTGSLPFTGSHTMATFLLGLFAIFVGTPMLRVGRRRWYARHMPAC